MNAIELLNEIDADRLTARLAELGAERDAIKRLLKIASKPAAKRTRKRRERPAEPFVPKDLTQESDE